MKVALDVDCTDYAAWIAQTNHAADEAMEPALASSESAGSRSDRERCETVPLVAAGTSVADFGGWVSKTSHRECTALVAQLDRVGCFPVFDRGLGAFAMLRAGNSSEQLDH